MIEQLTQFLHSWHLGWREVILGGVLFIVTFVISTGIVSFLIVKLPATYFQESHARDFLIDRHPFVRWTGLIMKNLIGVALVVLGIIMALPGVPGPGVVTILLGIMLLDFPGKRALELKLVSRPTVLGAINQMRGRFDKPPLVLD